MRPLSRMFWIWAILKFDKPMPFTSPSSTQLSISCGEQNRAQKNHRWNAMHAYRTTVEEQRIKYGKKFTSTKETSTSSELFSLHNIGSSYVKSKDLHTAVQCGALNWITSTWIISTDFETFCKFSVTKVIVKHFQFYLFNSKGLLLFHSKKIQILIKSIDLSDPLSALAYFSLYIFLFKFCTACTSFACNKFSSWSKK